MQIRVVSCQQKKKTKLHSDAGHAEEKETETSSHAVLCKSARVQIFIFALIIFDILSSSFLKRKCIFHIVHVTIQLVFIFFIRINDKTLMTGQRPFHVSQDKLGTRWELVRRMKP